MQKKLRIGIFGFGQTGKIVVGEFLNANDMDVKWVVKQHIAQPEPLANHFATSNKQAQLIGLNHVNKQFFINNNCNFCHSNTLM